MNLYFLICIIVRLLLAYSAFSLYNHRFRHLLAILFFAMSLGFLYQFIAQPRKIGAFHNKIWWNFLRPVHVLLFFMASIGLYLKFEYTYALLILDLFIGVVGFVRFSSLR